MNLSGMQFLRNVPPENYFRVAGGQVIKNLPELAGILDRLDDRSFQHHVSESRNDFARWITDCIQDSELAIQLSSLKDRHGMSRAIRSRVNQHLSPLSSADKQPEPSIDIDIDLPPIESQAEPLAKEQGSGKDEPPPIPFDDLMPELPPLHDLPEDPPPKKSAKPALPEKKESKSVETKSKTSKPESAKPQSTGKGKQPEAKPSKIVVKKAIKADKKEPMHIEDKKQAKSASPTVAEKKIAKAVAPESAGDKKEESPTQPVVAVKPHEIIEQAPVIKPDSLGQSQTAPGVDGHEAPDGQTPKMLLHDYAVKPKDDDPVLQKGTTDIRSEEIGEMLHSNGTYSTSLKSADLLHQDSAHHPSFTETGVMTTRIPQAHPDQKPAEIKTAAVPVHEHQDHKDSQEHHEPHQGHNAPDASQADYWHMEDAESVELRERVFIKFDNPLMSRLFEDGIPKICSLLNSSNPRINKTCLALREILDIAKMKRKCAYISLIDSDEKVVNYLLKLDPKSLDYINGGVLSIAAVDPFDIVDCTDHRPCIECGLPELRARCKHFSFLEEFSPDVVVIDNLRALELCYADPLQYTRFIHLLYKYLEKIGVIGIFLKDSCDKMICSSYEFTISDYVLHLDKMMWMIKPKFL
ncbi:MAG: hypothetical protein HGA85_07750, partial [Nanoarchaeota archaeon]|nr:hypothetical protein [Nanoarchaeota archaeon]